MLLSRFRSVLSTQTKCHSLAHKSASQFSRFNASPLSWTSTRSFANVRIPLESLGDSITTAVLLSWNKHTGDFVKEDDVIGVVETDKVTMEIRATKSGKFIEGLAAAGAEISVGSDLYVIDTDASGASIASSSAAPTTPKAVPSPTTAPAAPAAAVSKVTVPVPVMGESITQGVLASWLVKPGDFVKADAVVATIETDKVTVDVKSPQDGAIGELLFAQGAEVNVGGALFTLLAGASGTTSSPAASSKVAPSPAPKAPEVAKVAPSAPAEVKKPTTASSSAVTSSSSASLGERTETRAKMTRIRQRIAQRLKEAQNTAAMLTTFQEVDMTNLIALRNKYKEDFEKVHGVKLGFMSAFVKACTATLQEIPAVNGVIDDATQEIVYRNYIDISVAVASPNGLVVPVLRNTQKMNFADIEKAIADYGNKAKKGSLALEDMAGGTFTITNGGTFGSLFSTPMLNPPQSAILGMHATKPRAVVVDGKVEARPMMYLALTYDHRLIDGREAVVFLKSVANKIEDPAKMLLTL